MPSMDEQRNVSLVSHTGVPVATNQRTLFRQRFLWYTQACNKISIYSLQKRSVWTHTQSSLLQQQTHIHTYTHTSAFVKADHIHDSTILRFHWLSFKIQDRTFFLPIHLSNVFLYELQRKTHMLIKRLITREM